MNPSEYAYYAAIADSSYTGQLPSGVRAASQRWHGLSLGLEETGVAHERLASDVGLTVQALEDDSGPLLVFGGTTSGPGKQRDTWDRGLTNWPIHLAQWMTNIQMSVGRIPDNLELAHQIFEAISQGDSEKWRLVGHSKGASEAMAASSAGGRYIAFASPGLPQAWIEHHGVGTGVHCSVEEDPVTSLCQQLPWLVPPAPTQWVSVPKDTPVLSRHNDFSHWVNLWSKA